MQRSEKIPVLAGVLLVITAVVALLLATVNHITAPIIAANAAREQTEARKAVLQEATEFELIAEKPDNDIPVTAIYVGEKEGQLVGYCVNVQPIGYGGVIDLMVGIQADGAVERVKTITMSETAGLGSKAQDEAFLQQYAGKNVTDAFSVIKNGIPQQGEIVAVSGATVTSKAVTAGVNEALRAVKNLHKEGVK